MINKLKAYFTHKAKIPIGEYGKFSKVTEEYIELMDAHSQGKKYFTVIEASDLIDVTGRFTWKECRTPLLVIVLFCYIRRLYKLVRNPFLIRYLKKQNRWREPGMVK